MPTSRDWWASPFGMPPSMQDGAEVSRGKFDIYAGVTVDHCPRDFFLTTWRISELGANSAPGRDLSSGQRPRQCDPIRAQFRIVKPLPIRTQASITAPWTTHS